MRRYCAIMGVSCASADMRRTRYAGKFIRSKGFCGRCGNNSDFANNERRTIFTSMSSVQEIEAVIPKLSRAEVEEVRAWIDDYLENQLELTDEVKAILDQSRREHQLKPFAITPELEMWLLEAGGQAHDSADQIRLRRHPRTGARQNRRRMNARKSGDFIADVECQPKRFQK